MKRTVALIAALALLTCGLLPAYAASAIETTEENWYVVSHSDNFRVYYYAVVQNTGKKTVSVNDLLFQIQEADGTTIDSTSKYKLYPQVLASGESGWLVISKDVKDVDSKSDIDHYTLTITTKTNDDQEINLLTANAEYLKKDEDDNEDVLRASVKNDGSDSGFDITVAIAARDADGKLLYITGETAKNIGLPEGGALMQRSLIKSDIVDALEDAHTEVASAEAIAYTVVDLDD